MLFIAQLIVCSEEKQNKRASYAKSKFMNQFHFQKQGCQMVYFQTKNPNLGKFWRALDWKMLIYFMAIWNILWRFGIFYDHLVHFIFIWYILLVLVSCTKKNLATLFRSADLRSGDFKVTCSLGGEMSLDFPN
jgi:hypothetical protein